jgi:hypothetical protein
VETEIGDMTGAEMLAALRLQIDWGADEALGDAPVDRLRAQPPRVQPPRVQPPRIVAQTPSPEAAPAGIARPKAAAQPLTQAAQAATRAEQAAAASQDLTALREAVGGFDGCALRDTATSLVCCWSAMRPMPTRTAPAIRSPAPRAPIWTACWPASACRAARRC